MLKGWKTVIFNVTMTVVMLVSLWGGFGDTPAPTGEEVQAVVDKAEAAIVAVWGLGNLILRAITNSPIFRKDST